ncbi:MAG: T9SS type A sorting domain-containing protein [Calditrichaeota bacterium]|nr:T9SS type A sorting domain-containing protein [Calditrichota bacterium]
MRFVPPKSLMKTLLLSIPAAGAVVLVLWMSGAFAPSTAEVFRERMQKDQPGPDMRPSDWAWQRRTFPYGKADLQAVRDAMAHAGRMRAEASRYALEAVTYAGPGNVGGRVSDIEFNPQDPNIVYAGAATGGVFKSTDMGNTWFPVFDDQANLNIGDIGIDPQNPDVVYVGTGEANGGHNNFAGGGVYKSTDGGATWQFLGLENTVSVGRIVVDPSNSQRVFLAAVGSYFAPNPERGIYRSTDGGQTWEQSLFVTDSTGAIDIVIDPANPSRLLAATWERVRRPDTGWTHLYGPTSGIYRSLDGGDSWDPLGPANGLPNPAATNVGRIGLSLCAGSPDDVYAIYSDGSFHSGFYRSSDFGSNWIDADPDGEIEDGAASFSWYFGQVRVHPTDPNIVYAQDVAFMRSTNGGATWPIIYGYGGSPNGLHVDHHALAFNPANPSYLLEGNDGGINISTDGGVTFSKVADLPVNQFYEIGLDMNNPQRLYGGTQDNSTLRTLTGATNDWDVLFGGDGFYVIVDHTNPNIIYAESQNGNLGKSTDLGNSWDYVLSGINSSEPTNWSTPVVMDPNNNLVLYYGTNRLYKTVNGAGSWNAISGNLTSNVPGSRLRTITTIGVSPVDGDVLWVGTDDSHVWVTADGGATWTDVSSSLPYRWVTRVIPHPTDVNVAYVTFNGLKWVDPVPRVFRTADQGQTWSDVSSNLPDSPINAFAIDPANPAHIFVGSDLGAYYSLDEGGTWQYISGDFPMVSVYDMKVHPVGNYLAIGTHGRSMYRFDLAQLSVGIEAGDVPAPAGDFHLAQNYPNPFNPETVISYQLSAVGDVKLAVFNLLGETVIKLVNERQAAGSYQVQWDGRDQAGSRVPSGTYFYRLEVNGRENFRQTRKMQLVK